jgi:hypothetical protein
MYKRCKECAAFKPLDEFYRAAGTRDGRRGECKQCNLARKARWYRENRDREIARVRAWQAANPERVKTYRKERNVARRSENRDAHLVRTFGITQADYEAILEAQGGGCAICGEVPQDGQSFHVDHLGDRVRGILCVRCNNALGQLRERVDLAECAADYLEVGGFVPGGVHGLRSSAIEHALALRAA